MSIIDDLNAQLANVNKGISDLVEKIGVINQGKADTTALKSDMDSFSAAANSSIEELTQINGRVSSPVKASFFDDLADKVSGSGLSDLKSGLGEYEGKLDTKKSKFEQDKNELETLITNLKSQITEELNKILNT